MIFVCVGPLSRMTMTALYKKIKTFKRSHDGTEVYGGCNGTAAIIIGRRGVIFVKHESKTCNDSPMNADSHETRGSRRKFRHLSYMNKQTNQNKKKIRFTSWYCTYRGNAALLLGEECRIHRLPLLANTRKRLPAFLFKRKHIRRTRSCT